MNTPTGNSPSDSCLFVLESAFKEPDMVQLVPLFSLRVPFMRHCSRHSCCNMVRRDVLCHDRAGGNEGLVPDPDTMEYGNPEGNTGIVTDDNATVDSLRVIGFGMGMRDDADMLADAGRVANRDATLAVNERPFPDENIVPDLEELAEIEPDTIIAAEVLPAATEKFLCNHSPVRKGKIGCDAEGGPVNRFPEKVQVPLVGRERILVGHREIFAEQADIGKQRFSRDRTPDHVQDRCSLLLIKAAIEDFLDFREKGFNSRNAFIFLHTVMFLADMMSVVLAGVQRS